MRKIKAYKTILELGLILGTKDQIIRKQEILRKLKLGIEPTKEDINIIEETIKELNN